MNIAMGVFIVASCRPSGGGFLIAKKYVPCYSISAAPSLWKGGETMISSVLTLFIIPVIVGVIADVLAHFICSWLDNRKQKSRDE